jgi:hypothetical protein
MPTALDRLRERKQANHRDVPVCMDPSLPARKSELENRLSGLKTKLERRSNGSDSNIELEISEIEDELAALEARMVEASEWIRVKALAPDDYQELIDAHPPTKEQLREARKQHGARASLQWNTDTFPDALLGACCYGLTVKAIDPQTERPIFEKAEDQFTPEFVKEMRESGTWSSGEVGTFVSIAMAINENTANIGAAGNA